MCFIIALLLNVNLSDVITSTKMRNLFEKVVAFEEPHIWLRPEDLPESPGPLSEWNGFTNAQVDSQPLVRANELNGYSVASFRSEEDYSATNTRLSKEFEHMGNVIGQASGTVIAVLRRRHPGHWHQSLFGMGGCADNRFLFHTFVPHSANDRCPTHDCPHWQFGKLHTFEGWEFGELNQDCNEVCRSRREDLFCNAAQMTLIDNPLEVAVIASEMGAMCEHFWEDPYPTIPAYLDSWGNDHHICRYRENAQSECGARHSSHRRFCYCEPNVPVNWNSVHGDLMIRNAEILPENEWVILVLQRDADSRFVKSNGKKWSQHDLYSIGLWPMINPQTRARLVLGADDCGLGSGFHGDLAEFMIYHKALSEEQIQEIEDHLTEKFFTTGGPSFSPAASPSTSPSTFPSTSPSASPSVLPSSTFPSISPSASPSASPSTSLPSNSPSVSPSALSSSPSTSPSSSSLSTIPSASPSKTPSAPPSVSPSAALPSGSPSTSPSASTSPESFQPIVQDLDALPSETNEESDVGNTDESNQSRSNLVILILACLLSFILGMIISYFGREMNSNRSWEEHGRREPDHQFAHQDSDVPVHGEANHVDDNLQDGPYQVHNEGVAGASELVLKIPANIYEEGSSKKCET